MVPIHSEYQNRFSKITFHHFFRNIFFWHTYRGGCQMAQNVWERDGHVYEYAENAKMTQLAFPFGPFCQSRLVHDQINVSMPKWPIFAKPKEESQLGHLAFWAFWYTWPIPVTAILGHLGNVCVLSEWTFDSDVFRFFFESWFWKKTLHDIMFSYDVLNSNSGFDRGL